MTLLAGMYIREVPGLFQHNLIMLCDCWQTVDSDKACRSYVCNQYRRFAPHNHVRSEASNVTLMKLIRRVRRDSGWATEASCRCPSVGLCRRRNACSSGRSLSPSTETRSLASDRSGNSGCRLKPKYGLEYMSRTRVRI